MAYPLWDVAGPARRDQGSKARSLLSRKSLGLAQAGCLSSFGSWSVHGAKKVIDFLFGPVLLVAVVLLKFPQEFVFLAADQGQIIVGELAPLRLDFAAHLLPLAFQHV